MNDQKVSIWDPFVRVFHWSLVASFAIAWLSAESWKDLHEWAGYCAALLIGARLVWGLTGSHYARFRQFVRSPTTVVSFLSAMRHQKEPRYLGHNPAGGIMILALILAMAVTALTGWMYTLDAFWGETWVENVHEFTATLMLFMVVAHIAGVLFASHQHHENLVKSMIDGKKRRAEPGDIS